MRTVSRREARSRAGEANVDQGLEGPLSRGGIVDCVQRERGTRLQVPSVWEA